MRQFSYSKVETNKTTADEDTQKGTTNYRKENKGVPTVPVSH